MASGSTFLLSRVTNALLALAQVTLVARGYTAANAANFFVFWTVLWCTSIGVRFGFDQLVPKHAAREKMTGDLRELAGFRDLVARTLPLVCLVVPLVLAVVVPSATAPQIALGSVFCLIGGAAWALIFFVAGLLRGYGHVGSSGIVTGLVAPAAALAAVPVADSLHSSWTLLAGLTTVGLCLASAVTVVVGGRRIGMGRIGAALTTRVDRGVEPEVVSTGLLYGVAEVSFWLPLWLASILGASAAETAGLYAAIRVSAVFSWAFLTVAQVAAPLIAHSLAARDYSELRRVLRISAGAGIATTGPLALCGILLAPDLLRIVDPSYARFDLTLTILIAARLIDAVTGPLVETLVLGSHARWELANQLIGSVVILTAGALLHAEAGVAAFAWAYALAFTTQNLLRLVQVRQLFRGPWAGGGPALRGS